MTKPDAAKKPELDKLSFEELTSRLDALLEQMESGELPLEELLAKFETGSLLVKECRDRLGKFAKKLEVLTRDDGGNGQWSDFEPNLADAARNAGKEENPF